MKKRSGVINRRVNSARRVSRRNISNSRLRDTYGRLRERVFTREVIVILLVLLGGMIFFDAVGYDYTGMVAESNYLTGQQAGIPDTAIKNIGGTMSSIFKLIFEGFLGPALGIFGDNQAIATKLTLFVIVFVFILPVCNKIFKIEKGAKTVNSASIVAALISLLGIGLLPEAFVNKLSDTVPIILVIGFLAGVLYGLFKWKTEEKIASFIKGLVSLSALILLTYILGAFDASSGGSNLNDNLSGAIWVVAGFGYLVLAWLFLEGVFIKPFSGEARSASDVAERWVEGRRDVAEARNIKERGKLDREGLFAEREELKFKRNAPKKIKYVNKWVYSFLKDTGKNLKVGSKTTSVIAGVDQVLDMLRHSKNPSINVELVNMRTKLRNFSDVVNRVKQKNAADSTDISETEDALKSIEASLQEILNVL